MRQNLLKNKSTKSERIVYEELKKLHIPFKYRWKIKGREIDFLVKNRIALEIDGHLDMNVKKNEMLVKEGYVPLHIRNQEIYKYRDKLKKFLERI